MKKKKTETNTEKRIQETSKTMAKQEKGITLVALVITIIIIIILATVTINLSFGDNGLIKQAELAKDLTVNSTEHETQAMSNLVAYMKEEFKVGLPKVADLIGQEALSETTQIEDASGDNMWIPGGFGIASDSATDIDDGVVITDGTNEFVWIPVSDIDLAEMYSTTTPETAADTALAQSDLGEAVTTTKVYSRLRTSNTYIGGTPGSTSRREPDILVSTHGDASTTTARGINLLKSELGYEGDNATVLKNFAQDMVEEYLTVFNSIKQYDGFYIGRYELTGTADSPTVQRHQPVLTAYGANTWYGLKEACNRVVTGEDKDAQSYMIYGNQWDEVMDWIVDTQGRTDSEVNTDSSTWGNYSNSSGAAAVSGYGELQNAGHSDAWSANNIYDLARKLFGVDTRGARHRRSSFSWSAITSVQARAFQPQTATTTIRIAPTAATLVGQLYI